jgi:class 3 adenylate cyclase
MDLLDLHNRIVRHHVARHDGNEIKAQGDGFMLTFPSARAAAHAMIDVQRALATHARSHPNSAIRVRVGIHTGEAIIGDRGDLFGRHVVMAARVANCAHGGEILVSSLVREIVDSRGDLGFGEPRTVELKGLDGAHTVHPLLWSTTT